MPHTVSYQFYVHLRAPSPPSRMRGISAGRGLLHEDVEIRDGAQQQQQHTLRRHRPFRRGGMVRILCSLSFSLSFPLHWGRVVCARSRDASRPHTHTHMYTKTSDRARVNWHAYTHAHVNKLDPRTRRSRQSRETARLLAPLSDNLFHNREADSWRSYVPSLQGAFVSLLPIRITTLEILK